MVFGGMKGTTWVQIVKAVMLMTGAAIMTIWVLAKFGFNPSALLGLFSTHPPTANRIQALLQQG